jgi:P2-related tail formation protein
VTDQALSDPAPNVPATSGDAPSSLLNYLPVIYREDPFLGQFLLAFEKVLLGRQDQVPWPKCGSALRVAFPDRGLEQTIAQLPTYCNPKVQASEELPWLAKQAPEGFLPWLAKWTAFSLRAALSADQQRDFIAHAIRLYRRRGTKQGMEELLRRFTGAPPRIDEDAKRSHHFRVEIDLRVTAAEKEKVHIAEYIRRQKAVAHALIRLEKPAHTTFEGPYLRFSIFEIGKVRIGIDTLLSTKPSEDQGHG